MVTAANDPSHIPPLDGDTLARLKHAYKSVRLAEYGKSFEDCLADDLLRLALSNTAHALDAADRKRASERVNRSEP